MAAGSTYTPIATQTLASPASTVTFSSIPSTYTDLILVLSTSPTVDNVTGYIRVNGDTASNYGMTGIRGNGSNAASYSSPGSAMYFDYAGNTTTGTITTSIINFANYASTNVYKTNLVRQSNAGDAVEAMVQTWRSTSAITSILAYWSNGNFASGSTFTLYGLASA